MTIVAIVVAVVALGLLALLLARTTIGLHMRAAATDFRTARLLGVRANRVIGFAVVLSGVLAAAVAVILDRAVPARDAGLRASRRRSSCSSASSSAGSTGCWTATLGGFSIGFATGIINGALPTDKTVFLPSAVFALVILVLLLRPAGLFAGAAHDRRRPRMRRCVAAARGARRARRARRRRRDVRLGRERDPLPERARRRRDRRLDLRLRRQLGRALVRPDQLRRRGGVRGGRPDGAARVEDGRAARPLPAPARPHRRQRRLARARGGGRRRAGAGRRACR